MVLLPALKIFAVRYGLLRRFSLAASTDTSCAPRKALRTFAKNFLMRLQQKP